MFLFSFADKKIEVHRGENTCPPKGENSGLPNSTAPINLIPNMPSGKFWKAAFVKDC